jgi:hypothetical protein
MQEDKISKWFASMLRKQQEDNPLPYELGAWEAFEKKRNTIARKKTVSWVSGIAASLVLLLVAGGIWQSWDSTTQKALPSEQLALEEIPTLSDAQRPEPEESVKSEIKGSEKSDEENPDTPKENRFKQEKNVTKETDSKNSDARIKISADRRSEKTVSIEVNPVSSQPELSINTLPKTEKQTASPIVEQPETKERITAPEILQSLVATKKGQKGDKEVEKTEALEQKVIAKVELPKEPELTAEEIEEILESPSFVRLALGLSPGYGASQTSMQATSGSSLGLGMIVDMDVVGRLVVGSGLAVNYLNQASESQSYLQVAGFSSPITEKNEIAQVQLDIPLFFKYPITRSQSISIQAGFSNLVTFNQNAETQSSYTRQIAVLDASSALSSSFSLKSESVNQATVLEVPQNRFYPFATANLGVSFRLFESKKTSYEVMPFYNYPLQEFSGYGEKLGMFGASFKVNFGTIQRK